MTANNHAQPQLMTLGVVNQYIAEHDGNPPHLLTLATLRHMSVAGVMKHMNYLAKQGYIIRTGKLWHEIWVTEKGAA